MDLPGNTGGQVRIYSEPGKGTMVCIYLPRHYGDSVEHVHEVSVEPPRADKGETVLVVDDEASIRMLVVDVLRDLGYNAVEAADGPTAMKVLQSDLAIDLLITDVGLPNGMNGRQIADAARSITAEAHGCYSLLAMRKTLRLAMDTLSRA